MDPNLLIKAIEAGRTGRRYAFATVVEATLKGTPRKAGAKMVVLEDGTLWGSIGGGRNELAAKKECLKALRTGKPTLVTYDYFGQKGQSVCGGQMKVFIEPFPGTRELVICGAGHIALPLSLLGKMLNFKVTIIDNRKAFANKRRFPHADRILVGNHARKLSGLRTNEHTYIMIVTQGNEYDFQCLKAALKAKSGYLGVISSRAKRVKFFNRLKAKGVNPAALKHVRIPAGIDIGAQSPEEIAISIAAEMVAVGNKDLVGTVKFKDKKETVGRY